MERKNPWLSLFSAIVILALPLFYAWYIYPDLPDTIPIHFNAQGKADGFGGKSTIYLAPSILAITGLLVYLLITNIHRIDPRRYQQEQTPLFQQMALALCVFLAALSLLIIRSGAQPDTNILRYILLMVSLFIAVMGYWMPRIPPNYFMGLRLPWTLENEANWQATHRLAGKWWMRGGLLQGLLCWLMPAGLAWITFMLMMAVLVLVPVIYSYRLFRRQPGKNGA